ncbi:MAG: nucleotidyltransferase domain-containing protein [Bacteroidales bacterium]|nr:nucleotidyltransferase domain-containing protein [Bacteroidales bacterium]MCF8344797.1 nucleotidyltransferase domain-containing protein [Bacteroidales bacterium]MCF8351779.1 nucleotidyltransferase domain-containing protein [Bacteroidales bacterium]MCF8375582.1 nucleotidyltransferase domain-containing protein [Bacteroidales bacterium]
MNQETENITRLIRQSINKVDSNAEVILYGSRARGDERADSDWDILVLTNYPVDFAIEDKFRDALFDLELETGEVLTLFVYSKKEWQERQRFSPFYHNVQREGIEI